MNKQKNTHKVTSFLATCAGITAACICVLLIAGEYHSARSKFEVHNKEMQGWEAFRQTYPSYYKENETVVISSKENLGEAQNNFWLKITKVQLIGIFALGGVASAAAGYIVIWILAFIARASLHKFNAWLTIRLNGCPG